MVLTTGNKSEMSVGYATLYGDMNGGFNPIKDLYKTEVYRLARWRNAHRAQGRQGPGGVVIPQNIITRPPTAELRENQTDQDSLPPYEVLDDILDCLVEGEMPLADIVARGHDAAGRQESRAPALPRRVQAPPGRTRRQDLRPQLRPRPAIPHHQQVPGGDRRQRTNARRGEASTARPISSAIHPRATFRVLPVVPTTYVGSSPSMTVFHVMSDALSVHRHLVTGWRVQWASSGMDVDWD